MKQPTDALARAATATGSALLFKLQPDFLLSEHSEAVTWSSSTACSTHIQPHINESPPGLHAVWCRGASMPCLHFLPLSMPCLH